MIGYGHESPVPVDRPWLLKWVGFWTKSTNIAICELRPIQIKLHGDIAILQYLIFTVEVNAEGGKRVIRRYTMTWKKTNRRSAGWQVIGSHNNLMEETLRHCVETINENETQGVVCNRRRHLYAPNGIGNDACYRAHD